LVAQVEAVAADAKIDAGTDLLVQWFTGPSTLPSACEMLVESSQDYALVNAAKHIERNIPLFLGHLEPEVRLHAFG
jgi:isoleucyl-tRNA synthetase